MARWQEDEIDVAASTWALQWVEHFGRDPDRAGRYIGPLGCTLGRVRELHDGASSSTERSSQHWPEVYLGTGLIVAITLKAMTEGSRAIVWHHYVWRWYDQPKWSRRQRPAKQRIVAEHLGVSLAEYYHRRDTAKACLRVGLFVDAEDLASVSLDTKVRASAHGLEVQSRQAS
jgi:hypothetical protein